MENRYLLVVTADPIYTFCSNFLPFTAIFTANFLIQKILLWITLPMPSKLGQTWRCVYSRLHLCLNIAYCVTRQRDKNYHGYGTPQDQSGGSADPFHGGLWSCLSQICAMQPLQQHAICTIPVDCTRWFDPTLFSVHSCSTRKTDGWQRFWDCSNKFTSVTTLSGEFSSSVPVVRHIVHHSYMTPPSMLKHCL